MRVKISFLRSQGSLNTVPLHHQKIIWSTIQSVLQEIPGHEGEFNFSSLKGTSKVKNGFMRFLSSKITLVMSSGNDALMNAFVEKIFTLPEVAFGRMVLIPKSYETIPTPEFQKEMKCVCISPIVLSDPELDPTNSQEIIDPASQQFSDFLFNSMMDRLEKSGVSESKLNEYAEFEASPDHEYLQKLTETGKKFARFYKSCNGQSMIGYLLPFQLHAHPDIHKYFWDQGIGSLTEEGYGMIDYVI